MDSYMKAILVSVCVQVDELIEIVPPSELKE